MATPRETLEALAAALGEARARCDELVAGGPAALVDLEFHAWTEARQSIVALGRALAPALECLDAASQPDSWRIGPDEPLRLRVQVIPHVARAAEPPREYLFPPRQGPRGADFSEKAHEPQFVTVGSIDANDLPLRDVSGISKRHLGLKRAHDQIEAADFGSAGGTFVNGRKVTRTFLRHGDQLRIGGAILTVLFGDRADPPPTSPDWR